VLGALLFAVLYVIIYAKLGMEGTINSYWLKKAKQRVWSLSIISAIIIGGILALGLPSYIAKLENDERQRQETSNVAISILQSVLSAQATYQTMYQRYAPSLSTLYGVRLLNRYEVAGCTASGIESKPINGYLLQMTGRENTFILRMRPSQPNPTLNCWSVDETGIYQIINDY
jgi:multisubunit Na+/H+ antiporter MnhB subunit